MMRRPIIPRRHTREPRRLPAAYPSRVYSDDQLSWNSEPKEFSFDSSSYPNWGQSKRNGLPESLRIARPRKLDMEKEHEADYSEGNYRTDESGESYRAESSDRSYRTEESGDSLGGIHLPEEASGGETLEGQTLEERKEKFVAAQVSSSETLCGFPYAIPCRGVEEVTPKTIPEHPLLSAPLSGTAEDKIEQLAKVRKQLLSEEEEVLGRFRNAIIGIYRNKHARLEKLRKDVIKEHLSKERDREDVEVYHELGTGEVAWELEG